MKAASCGIEALPIEGEAFRPFKILYSTVYYREVRPTFVVDISRHFDRRTKPFSRITRSSVQAKIRSKVDIH